MLESVEYVIYNKEMFRDLADLLPERPFIYLSPLSVDQEVLKGRVQRFHVPF